MECGGWGTLQLETVSTDEVKGNAAIGAAPAEVIDLSKIKEINLQRLPTGIGEFDRVVGGGIVPGSLILLSGEPGIGKSTIVAQVADKIGSKGKGEVFYVSGEESAGQGKSRLDRLNCGLENIKFISETDADKICAALKKEKPALAIIDSIQTVYCPEIASEAGGLLQIRAAAVKFLEVAKKRRLLLDRPHHQRWQHCRTEIARAYRRHGDLSGSRHHQ